jgi:hypothetical protein
MAVTLNLRAAAFVFCVMLGLAAPAFADLPAFNRAVLASDYRAAAKAAEETWPSLDHKRAEIAVIAREFAWMSMLGGRPEKAREYAGFLTGTPGLNDTTPQTSKILQAWAGFRLADTPENRKALLEALNGSLALPGADLVAIVAAVDLVAAGESGAGVIADELQKRRVPPLTRQRRAELNAIVNAFGEKRDAASYMAMVRLDEALDGEAFHPANASMRKELFALHDEAWAWRTVMESILRSSRTGYPVVGVRHPELLWLREPLVAGQKPPCPGSVDRLKEIRFPFAERKDWLTGSVIVDAAFDAEGRAVNPQVLAAIPPESGFADAVLSAAAKWKFVPAEDADRSECTIERKHHAIVVQFTFGGPPQ